MELIPLEPIPNQELNVTLDDQDCTLTVFQRGRRLYLTLVADGTTIRQGALCLPRVGILGDATTFSGQLYFVDADRETDKQQPPQYDELGSRFFLYYVTDDEEEEIQEQIEANALEA